MLIRFVFSARGVDQPTYLDVGAYHPYKFSNTAHFYENGSRGINIEANPVLFRQFERLRPDDINLNIGVMEESGERTFYAMSPSTMSTFSRDVAEDLVKMHGFKIVECKKVQIQTMTEVLDNWATERYPDFLSVDAEGCEEQILRSMNYGVWSPTVICCETISYSESGHGAKNASLIDFLKTRGYMVYADTYINTVFVLEAFWRR